VPFVPFVPFVLYLFTKTQHLAFGTELNLMCSTTKTTPITMTTEQEILTEGLTLHQLHQKRAKSKRGAKSELDRFRSMFGISPVSVKKLFDDLETSLPSPCMKKLLSALMWLKTYLTETQMSFISGSDMKTLRQYNWKYVTAIAELKVLKIDKEFDLANEVAEIPITVDGTHCPILEPRKEPSKTWYSHKYNGPGLSYEIAMLIHRPQIAWINGPFKAGVSDSAIFMKEGGLKEKLEASGKLAIADDGYKGQHEILITKNPFYSDEVNTYIKRARARQESVNKRIKDFKAVSSVFRHGHEKHGIVFHAVAVLLQYDMENGSPVFDF